MEEVYDIIIIGAGPAGMTAAIYAARNGKRVLILEKAGVGGQIASSPKVENIPGFISISGLEFSNKMFDQLMNLGVVFEVEEVLGLEPSYMTVDGQDVVDLISVTTDVGIHWAKTVILANGVKHRLLPLPGIEDLVGNGISFCAVCDGDFYKNKEVIVIGGGNSALVEGELLTEKCEDVYFLQDLSEFTAEESLKERVLNKQNVFTFTNCKIVSIEKVKDPRVTDGNEVMHVIWDDTKEGTRRSLYADGVFMCIGLIPDNKRFSNQYPLDEYGYFDPDSITQSTLPVFVAGDCRKKTLRQVVTACADGAQAAINACKYIDTGKVVVV